MAFLQQITGTQGLDELRNRVRTGQAGRGLLYGGAAAKQETRTLGQYRQGQQLQAAMQLSELTQREELLPMEIASLVAQTEQATAGAALGQLGTPITALGDLYGGASQGLGSIFGLTGGIV